MDEIIFRITRRHGLDGEVVLALAGEFDLGGEDAFAQALSEALCGGGDGDGSGPDLLIDLAGLTFLGSTGIRFLLEARARTHAKGRHFAVFGASGSVLRTLWMVRALEPLGVYGDGAFYADDHGPASADGDGVRSRSA